MQWRMMVLLLSVAAVAACSKDREEAQLFVLVGPNNPGPGQTGSADVEILQMSLTAREEAMVVTGLRLHAWGSGDDATEVSQVRLYRDGNGDGTLDGGDTLLSAAQGFPGDDGNLRMAGLSEVIGTASSSHWLVVYDLFPGPAAGKTFCVGPLAATDVEATWRGRPTGQVILGAGVEGCVTAPPGSLVVAPGPDTPPPRTRGPCLGDEAILQLFLSPGSVEAVLVEEIRFEASGTGDDLADLGGVRLYVDADEDGLLGGADSLLGGPTPYTGDDGTVTFPGIGRTIPAASSERWLLVYDGAGNIPSGSTFAAAVLTPTDIIATGVSSGQGVSIAGPPVVSSFITLEQPQLLSALYTDEDSNGVVDQGDRVVVTFSEEVVLLGALRADDIFSALPGTFGNSTIGPGQGPRELEIVLQSSQFLQPNGTFGAGPTSSGVGIWNGQTDLGNCLSIPIPSPGSFVDLQGEANPRVLRARVTDSNGNCAVDGGDTVDVVFTTGVTLTTADPALAFTLPVGGDSFGTGSVFVGGPMPTDVVTVSILLGTSPTLTPSGSFDPLSLSPGSSSGLDISSTPSLVVDARFPNVTALPDGVAPRDLTDAPLWHSSGDDQLGSGFGWQVVSAGDVDGNGYADILVGAPTFTQSVQNEGKAYLYLGGPGGIAPTPGWSSTGDDQAGAGFGFAVAAAGDVDNDGFDDILLGAPSHDGAAADAGRVYLFLGGPGGPSPAPDWTHSGNDQAGAAFGSSLALLGDLNADGFSDVVIGAPAFSTPDPQAGKAYLFLGGSGGLDPTPSWTALGDDQPYANYGTSVASAGDVDLNGSPDLVVGADGFDGLQEDTGKAYLYLGGAGVLSPVPDWTSTGEDAAFARFGSSLACAGDVNDDGRSDVIVGASDHSGKTGKVYVFHGEATGLSPSFLWSSVGDDQVDAGFGRSVASAGDVDGDGISDVLIGAFTYRTRRPGAGKVYVYRGSVGGLSATPWWTTSGEDQEQAQFGLSVASAGDVNGDSVSEILVGAPLFSTLTSGPAGKAYLFCLQ